jgi:transcription initiation factor IIE alpha subunit
MKKDPIEILSNYQHRTELMKEQKTPHKDIKPFETTELLLLKALLHPTDRKESKDMTRELIKYICDQGIVTAEQIYEHFDWSDNPVMKRLKIFREFGLVKREAKKYYMPTPRLIELRKTYLERVCG